MIRLDLNKVAEFAKRGETEDLLDRVTVFRDQMEPAAVELFVDELDRRGVSEAEIRLHGRLRAETAVYDREGAALRCMFCSRPAVVKNWSWHRLWGVLPVFPRPTARCERHGGIPRSQDDPCGPIWPVS